MGSRQQEVVRRERKIPSLRPILTSGRPTSPVHGSLGLARGMQGMQRVVKTGADALGSALGADEDGWVSKGLSASQAGLHSVAKVVLNPVKTTADVVAAAADPEAFLQGASDVVGSGLGKVRGVMKAGFKQMDLSFLEAPVREVWDGQEEEEGDAAAFFPQIFRKAQLPHKTLVLAARLALGMANTAQEESDDDVPAAAMGRRLALGQSDISVLRDALVHAVEADADSGFVVAHKPWEEKRKQRKSLAGMSGPKIATMPSAPRSATMLNTKSSFSAIAMEVIRDPRNTAAWQLLVSHSVFELNIGHLILLNCVSLGVETQQCPANFYPEKAGRWSGPQLLPDGTLVADSADCPRAVLQICEHLFTLIFVVEFFMRVRAFGFSHYAPGRDLWSWARFFDGAIVWAAGVGIFWLLPLGIYVAGGEGLSSRTATSVRAIQVGRGLRLARLTRAVKQLPQFREMWLLVKGLMDSTRTLFWTVVVIVFMLFGFSVLFVSLVADDKQYDVRDIVLSDELEFFTDDVTNATCSAPSSPSFVQVYFPSLPRTMLTLLQVMTGDNWSNVVRFVIERQGFMVFVFATYICLAMFVLLNLVTAIIVDNSLSISNQDEQDRALQKKAEEEKIARQLGLLLQVLDQDGSGDITREELEEQLGSNDEIVAKFHKLGLEEDTVLQLFEVLDVDQQGVGCGEFIHGLLQAQGELRSFDLLCTQKMVERVRTDLVQIQAKIEAGIKAVADSLVAFSFQDMQQSAKRRASRKQTVDTEDLDVPEDSEEEVDLISGDELRESTRNEVDVLQDMLSQLTAGLESGASMRAASPLPEDWSPPRRRARTAGVLE